ncbi:MAG: PQQ-binding-like beta-propeller repeat protein [Nitrospiraceae bacterium]|nr:PQQ-binding-like beta-propeller repeat protein [Nitrospiraceae bacterium]
MLNRAITRRLLDHTLCLIMAGLLTLGAFPAIGEDWPTFRHDNARSAITSEQLQFPLSANWTFQPTDAPEPAWTNPAKEKARVRFDEAYHVAAAGDSVYFASSADNTVYCLDASDSSKRWTFITGGPIRVAPTVSEGRVYIGSDDGCVYCLNAADGSLVWKVRAAWRDQRVVGNGKMISLWPVRTGVAVDNGVAYFGAGVFPHESIFICAVDAADGTLLWRNDTVGEEGYKQEFGGISPQGAFLLSEDSLFVPSGRAMPAAFDRESGALRYYLPPGGKVGGTWALLTDSRVVAGVEAKRAYDQASGSRVGDAAYAWFPGTHLVVADDYAYLLNFEELVALDRAAFKSAGAARARVFEERAPIAKDLRALKAQVRSAEGEAKKALEDRIRAASTRIKELNEEQRRIEDGVHSWRRACDMQDALAMAGDHLLIGGEGRVSAALAATGEEVWSAPVNGRACGIAVANGRLLVSTDTGSIHSFAHAPETTSTESSRSKETEETSLPTDEKHAALCAKAADQIVAEAGVTDGFCLVIGSGTGELALQLAKRTNLRIVGVDNDPDSVKRARALLVDAGLYGSRVTFDQAALSELPYADYFANLIVSERILTTTRPPGAREEMLRLLKPHGGVGFFGRPEEAGVNEELPDPVEVQAWLSQFGDYEAGVVAGNGRWVKITRGALEGEGKWTHLYANAANTACSDDERVRGSLGTLWFGAPGPERMVERHARPAAPLAMDGRMFVQGENVVMAYDSYNGVRLWQTELPGALRVRVDSDMGNIALARDGLYVAAYDQCVRLDPATGKTMRTYTLPTTTGKNARRWGYIACVDDTLFGTVAPTLREDYGELWDAIVDEEARSWVDLDGTMERNGIAAKYGDDLARFKAAYPEPNGRAYWEAQQSGMMWRAMSPWPAWGSVQSPEGAVTDRIMASNTFFALDTETGDLRWRYDGGPIAHPAIAIADGLVFLADCAVTDAQKEAAMAEREALMERGVWERAKTPYDAKDADVRLVVALDAATGERVWERVIDLTGCGGDRLGLAAADGVLCFFGCFSNHDRGLFKDGKLEWRRITAVSTKDGSDIWSRPLNYLRRPVIMGDTILIEPRACDLRTGAIKKRTHPITGAESTWEFVRPGHCCSVTSASPYMFFLRGYHLWYYDVERDQGMLPFGGIRPGCWINMIPANGLLLFPEASAGCTCSYPIRSTVVLQPKKEQKTWSFLVQHGNLTPVKHLAINLGAPGDWRDEDGTMWFAYPHPPSTSWQEYGLNFDLQEQFLGTPSFFRVNFQGVEFKNTDKPWLLASGCEGMTSCKLPLLEDGQAPAVYTVRLYFVETKHTTPGARVFSVKLQGNTVTERLDIVAEAGGPNAAVVKEYGGIRVENTLHVELTPSTPAPGSGEGPILNGIEVIREEVAVASLPDVNS